MSFHSLLESTLQTVIELDSGSKDRLAFLNDRIIAVEIVGSGQTLYISGMNGQMRLHDKCSYPPDTSICGTPLNLVRLMRSNDVAPLLLSGKIQIKGDLRLGRQLKNILFSLDIDWEEQLSHVIGDTASHQLVRLHKRLTLWAKRSRESITLDLGDFLQEEARLIPSKAEQHHWLNQVDDCRNKADRLGARIDRLVKTQASKT